MSAASSAVVAAAAPVPASTSAQGQEALSTTISSAASTLVPSSFSAQTSASASPNSPAYHSPAGESQQPESTTAPLINASKLASAAAKARLQLVQRTLGGAKNISQGSQIKKMVAEKQHRVAVIGSGNWWV